MRIKWIAFSVIFCCALQSALAQQQAEDKTCRFPLKLHAGADIMSGYVFRGTEYGNSPSVQPVLSLSAGNFELGAWGAMALASSYKEVDLYAKYSLKDFSLTVTDYYIPFANGGNASPDPRFLNYTDEVTAHTLEGSLQYKRTQKIPLWVSANLYFYGNDKRWGYDAGKDTTDKTYYSSYFEAGYSFAVKQNTADVFLGFTPSAGAYGNTLGVVNAGVTASRKIRITSDFELPVRASLIVNPQTSNIYFLFGFTL